MDTPRLRQSVVTCLALFVWVTESAMTDQCRRCICEAEGAQFCDGMMLRCTDFEPRGCGPYQITQDFWCEARGLSAPENCPAEWKSEWQACTTSWDCANSTIDAYMERFSQLCAPNPNCEQYSKMYRHGNLNCNTNDDSFWNLVKDCCLNPENVDIC